MNFPRALFVAGLVLCSCKKPAPSLDAGVVIDAKAMALRDLAMDAGPPLAKSPKKDAGIASANCLGPIAWDGGMSDDPAQFTGFSSDGRRFAFSVHSEGAGAFVLSIIEPTNTVIRKFLLDTLESRAEAKAFLADGGYTRDRRASGLRVDLGAGVARVTTPSGDVLYSGTPFQGTSGHNLRAELWGCDQRGARAALEVSQQFENEYGNARAYVIFDATRAQPEKQ